MLCYLNLSIGHVRYLLQCSLEKTGLLWLGGIFLNRDMVEFSIVCVAEPLYISPDSEKEPQSGFRILVLVGRLYTEICVTDGVL